MDSTGSCKVATLVQGASGLFPSGNLRTGKRIVVHRSRPRARGWRENIRIGVVGDNSFGWAEAAQLWGVEVEVIIHKVHDHHCLSSCFQLPDSCDYEEALYLFPLTSCLMGRAAINDSWRAFGCEGLWDSVGTLGPNYCNYCLQVKYVAVSQSRVFLATLTGNHEEVHTLLVFTKSLGPRWSH